jgi:alkylhydroperoxidase family enzyme
MTTSTAASTTGQRAPEHTPRLALAELAPEVYRAMTRLDAAAAKGVDPTLLELVKVRASQINLIAAITVINAWNRFGITTRMVPGHYQPRG